LPTDRTVTVDRRWAAARPGGVVVALALLALATVAASFAVLPLNLGDLFGPGAGPAMLAFLGEFMHPELSAAYVRQVAWAAVQTLAVSAVGTLLAVVAGAALALPAAGRLGLPARWTSRGVLNVLRSIPELVWAVLMVLAAGLGPFAGALALGAHTTGVLGRLYAEALENTSPAPEAALRGAGSSAVPAFLYGTLPLVAAQGTAYALYRWEMNIRMAAVLGLVGGGGLGQMLYVSLSLFQHAQASTVLIATLVLVIGVEWLSSAIRQRLA